MSRILHNIISLTVIACAIIVSSCQKDDTLQYNNATMGNIVDGKFVSDQGNIFNVTEQCCQGKLDTMKRAFVVCDVLRKTPSGKENEYDVKVNQIIRVLTKNIVPKANTNDEMQVQDALHIEYAWVAGGYLNLFILFPIQASSNTKHLINLVHEGSIINSETEQEESGTYRFSLRHNSYGDKIDDSKSTSYIMAGSYVSFPLNNYIIQDEAKFTIEWNAGKGMDPDSEPITRYYTMKYSKQGFQHAPTNMPLQPVAIVD